MKLILPQPNSHWKIGSSEELVIYSNKSCYITGALAKLYPNLLCIEKKQIYQWLNKKILKKKVE